ncbi:dienelactone hydrolase family protein [Roseitalea porphyridii]|uniref:Dienelactone hydrolase family protein n=1 Tax=Roseitalea porphyridii TaxID=1852022 RepID=A0A4P6V6Z0_9HYPH|nr:dienelactone hydrolase family protein [Roseitalea porphyridii]QBK32474.1 dienelactone hydrolase family protein [Roseitalea porphyridii]
MKRLTLSLAAAASLCATTASAEIVGESFTYEVGGETFEGYVARNTNAEPRGSVMLVHDWDGMTDYEMRRADMLAALGYTAFALDVYGADTDPQSVDEYRALSGALYGDRERFRTLLQGSLDAAAENIEGWTDDVVVAGYCFGGAAVLEMARAGADVDGFVSFHGGLGTPEGQDYSAASAPVLLLHGSADPVSGMSDLASLLDQLQGAGVPHAAQVFGGARHSFTVFGSGDYDLAADRGAWDAFEAFLAENL